MDQSQKSDLTKTHFDQILTNKLASFSWTGPKKVKFDQHCPILTQLTIFSLILT